MTLRRTQQREAPDTDFRSEHTLNPAEYDRWLPRDKYAFKLMALSGISKVALEVPGGTITYEEVS